MLATSSTGKAYSTKLRELSLTPRKLHTINFVKYFSHPNMRDVYGYTAVDMFIAVFTGLYH